MNEKKSGYGYGARPLWQWIFLYAIIGGVLYGLVYYFIFAGYDYNSVAPTQNGSLKLPPSPLY